MLGDYLRSFWRGVLHNKVSALINVGGLALGFAVFFALTFYVDREFSWDAHWDDAERIYILAGAQESATGTTSSLMTSSPYALGESLQGRHPDAFEVYARVFQTSAPVTTEGNDFPFVQRFHVEPALLDLLQFETLEGSLDDVMRDPRAIAISQATAERFYGDVSPLGKTLSFTPQQGAGLPSANGDFVIRAVFVLPPPTSVNIATLAVLEPSAPPQPGARLDLWQFIPGTPAQPGQAATPAVQPFYVTHYFKLRQGADVSVIEQDLRRFMDENRYMDSGLSKTRFTFRKLQDQHLSPSPFDTGNAVQRLWVYAAIGVLVLLISGCNFVMLATLRLVDRMREVGVRKSVGGGAGQLMGQYLIDAFLHTLLAALLAVLFLAFVFPQLQVMLQLPLQLNMLTPRNIGLSLLMVLFFTALSSLYPAWLTAQVKPGPLLRNGSGAVVGTGTGLRKLLVGIQFAIVIVLLLATAVARQQIEYTRNRDPGFSVERVVGVQVRAFELGQKVGALVEEFRRVPGVEAASVGGSPGMLIIATPTLVKAFAPDGSVREAGLEPTSSVGAGYFSVMSIPVLAGREFSEGLDTVPPPPPGTPPGTAALGPRNVILNAAAARALGFSSPDAAIEQLLEVESTTPDRQLRKQSLRVVGVVADTQMTSVMMPPPPLLYYFTAQNNFVAAKLAPDADREAVTQELEEAWDSVLNGAGAFEPVDIDGINGFMLAREEFEARIVTGSTLLAIAIALLGLYGLVAATVVKRVKEIGVRKVMGADRGTIVQLFLWQFSKPILAANLVAWPLGFWAIKQWMQRFPYQLDTTVIVLTGLAASLVALSIAWLTVGVMASRAATVNPVSALRYE